MGRSIKRFLNLWILMLAAAPAWAGEGVREIESKALLVYHGYGEHENPNQSVEIPLYLNQVKLDQGSPSFWPISMEVPQEHRLQLAQALTQAVGLWQYSPHVRLRFTLSGWRKIDYTFKRDGDNLIGFPQTLKGVSYARTHLVKNPTTQRPEIAEFDIECIPQDIVSQKSAPLLVAHEIGHGLGFNHSLVSGESLMSWCRKGEVQENADQGLLGPDDLSIAAELYPDHRHRLSNTCGTIFGQAMAANGRDPLQHAYVGVHTKDGRRILNRIGGYRAELGPGGFQIFGVPEGEYTLVVADKTLYEWSGDIYEARYPEQEWQRSGPSRGWWPAFETATVTNVVVKAGQVTDVGRVLAGVHRNYQSPSLVDVMVKIPKNPKYHRYWVSFWSWKPWGKAHDSGELQQPGGYFATVPNGWNAVKIWGKYGWWPWQWEVVQNWKWVDFHAREAIFQWSSVKFGDFEAKYSFSFTIKRETYGGVVFYVYPVANKVWEQSYRVMIPPGTYLWNIISEAPGKPIPKQFKKESGEVKVD